MFSIALSTIDFAFSSSLMRAQLSQTQEASIQKKGWYEKRKNTTLCSRVRIVYILKQHIR